MSKQEDDIYSVGFDGGWKAAKAEWLRWVRSLEYNFDQYGHEFKHREFIEHKIAELEKEVDEDSDD